jgi:hypothetical protein
LGLRGRKKGETGENYVTKSFMVCTPYQIWLGTMKGAGTVAHAREKGNAYRILMGKLALKRERGGYCRHGA